MNIVRVLGKCVQYFLTNAILQKHLKIQLQNKQIEDVFYDYGDFMLFMGDQWKFVYLIEIDGGSFTYRNTVLFLVGIVKVLLLQKMSVDDISWLYFRLKKDWVRFLYREILWKLFSFKKVFSKLKSINRF